MGEELGDTGESLGVAGEETGDMMEESPEICESVGDSWVWGAECQSKLGMMAGSSWETGEYLRAWKCEPPHLANIRYFLM